VLFGYDSLPNAIASGDRTISLHHIHTKEEITVTYKRSGRYDPDAMKKLDWFLRDWRRDEAVKTDPQLIDLIWEVQQEVGAKKPIWIICGYRAPATNSMLRARSRNSGVANNSMHTIGRAIDFYIPDASLEELRIAGMRFQRGGVGYYPSSGSPFVHMDTSSVRHWPRMSRDQLARVFPNGRTVHIPSDGQPLSGYALALADVEKRGGSASQMSAEAARVAGVSTDAKPRAARNLLASLFGVKDKEEEDDVATTASVAARPAVKPVAIKPVTVKRDAIASLVEKQDVVRPAPAALPAPRRGVPEALEHATTVKLAAVPMPPARPARPAATVVAAASSPAGIVAARGMWDADGGLKQISDPATFKVAMADAPASGALAYAPTAVVPVERKRGGSTSGASIRNVSATIRTQAVTAQPSFDDIWMRAIVLTPSLQNFMSVTMIGMNEKDLRPLMRKPTTALTMTFSDDPMGGIATERFNGESSVVFLDTVSFVTRTAFLQP
jgi:uncharacterized protein YcbK (DUF882 family)